MTSFVERRMGKPRMRRRRFNRDQLVAYLAYAIDEVALYSRTGASLLEMAIATLEEELPDRPPRQPVHKLS